MLNAYRSNAEWSDGDRCCLRTSVNQFCSCRKTPPSDYTIHTTLIGAPLAIRCIDLANLISLATAYQTFPSNLPHPSTPPSRTIACAPKYRTSTPYLPAESYLRSNRKRYIITLFAARLRRIHTWPLCVGIIMQLTREWTRSDHLIASSLLVPVTRLDAVAATVAWIVAVERSDSFLKGIAWLT